MMHLSVTILTLPNGKLVLQRRSLDAPLEPGSLAIFGGHAENNETPDQTAKRELAEETSLQVGKLDFIILGDCERPPTNVDADQRTFHVFQVKISDTHFEVYEGQGAETYELTEVLARDDVATTAHVLLEKIRSNQWHLA